MKRSVVLMSIIILFFVIIIMIINSSTTYGYELDFSNYTLFYKENTNELKDDLKKYISSIDDILISNSKFEYSNILIDNYDFLTYFALDHVLENYEYYKNEIIELDKHSYLTKDGLIKETNKYINIDVIYKITSKYFNVNYYQIINKDVNIIDNYISLINYSDIYFDLVIQDIFVEINNDYINVIVNYENNNKYKYVFVKKNNILYLFNLEVIYE